MARAITFGLHLRHPVKSFLKEVRHDILIHFFDDLNYG